MNTSNNLIIVGKNTNITVKNFDSLDEFQQYYNLHKDEIEKISTVKLNRMFKIKDHKITRRTIDGNEEKTLCFRQLLKNELASSAPPTIEESRLVELENTISELTAKIKAVEVDNMKLKSQMIEIINALNAS